MKEGGTVQLVNILLSRSGMFPREEVSKPVLRPTPPLRQNPIFTEGRGGGCLYTDEKFPFWQKSPLQLKI